jgi:HEAT repeat protein
MAAFPQRKVGAAEAAPTSFALGLPMARFGRDSGGVRGKLCGSTMLWLIQRQLKSKNGATRRKAAERLCDAPDSHALRALDDALGDEDAEVRRLAATALGKLEEEGRLEPLFRALRDRDADVQKAAILGLKKTSDERVPAALLPLLRHPNAGVRGSAAQVLEFVGWRPAKPEEEMWFLVAKGQCSRVAAYGAAALLPLEMVLNAGPYSLCVAAVQALGEIEDQRAVRLLLKALKSNDAAVCVAAVDSLTRVGGAQASEPLIGMLQHKNGQVRAAAVEALGSLGAAAAAAPVRALLSDPAWEVRRAAIETLGRLKDERAVEALSHTLADQDSDVREATAIALGAMSDRRAIGPLVVALKDPTSGVRRIAAAALSRIDEDWATSAEARAAVEELKPALYDRDPDVRRFVGHLLVSLGAAEPEAAQEPRAQEMSASTAEKRRKLAVSLFLAILCDRDPDLRQAAAEALGRLGERRAEPALMRAIRDPEATVRTAAERALLVLTATRAGS